MGNQLGKTRLLNNTGDNAQYDHNKKQLILCFMTASFALGSPVLRGGQKCARQYNSLPPFTIADGGFFDMAQALRASEPDDAAV
ncbi:hypothetical protein KoxyNG13_046840 [Klebsiella pasteurii]